MMAMSCNNKHQVLVGYQTHQAHVLVGPRRLDCHITEDTSDLNSAKKKKFFPICTAA